MHTISPLKIPETLSSQRLERPLYPITINGKKGQEIECADPIISRALLALMNLEAINGGAATHWGGPSAMVEMMSALHSFMFQRENTWDHYNFVNDIGHAENGLYALRANWGLAGLKIEDLKGFRSIKSKLTGHGERHLFPEAVMLSNGPLSSAVAQAQGLALADKIAKNKRVTICSISDGACMEGEAKESFAAIPGQAKRGELAPFLLIVSDNNTKLSGRINQDSFDMAPSFEAMETLGWKTVKLEEGHDLTACYQCLEEVLENINDKRPVFLWLKTTKGKGVKSTEDSSSGGHGMPLKPYSEEIHQFLSEIFNQDVPTFFQEWAEQLTQKPESKLANSSETSKSSVVTSKAQAGFAKAAIECAKANLPVISVSSDLQGSTGMAPFHKEFPEQSFDMGIAESNMASVAVGLSRQGFIPIIDTFAAFGVTKGNLPLIMASLSMSPLIAVFSHTGFQDAADGASHQSTTYLAAISAIPYCEAIVVSCADEAYALMKEAIQTTAEQREEGKKAKSYIFFVGRENFPTTLGDNIQYQLGKAQVIKKGNAGVVLACGPMLFQALQAAEKLASMNINITVINSSSVNSPDTELIETELKMNKNILVTIEDHQEIGGMGQMLVSKLVARGAQFTYHPLAIKGEFGRSAYTANQLYERYQISVDQIVKIFS